MTKIRKHFTRPIIISRPIRSFDLLTAAGLFIDCLTVSNGQDYRFNIIQQGSSRTVCSVISEEV